jgi:hypothetical protein
MKAKINKIILLAILIVSVITFIIIAVSSVDKNIKSKCRSLGFDRENHYWEYLEFSENNKNCPFLVILAKPGDEIYWELSIDGLSINGESYVNKESESILFIENGHLKHIKFSNQLINLYRQEDSQKIVDYFQKIISGGVNISSALTCPQS